MCGSTEPGFVDPIDSGTLARPGVLYLAVDSSYAGMGVPPTPTVVP